MNEFYKLPDLGR